MVDTVKIKRPSTGESDSVPSGRVIHDERGNAGWKWGLNTEPNPGEATAGLSIATTGGHESGAWSERRGAPGHSPYDKGAVKKPVAKRKRSLRELSDVIANTKHWDKNSKL